MSSTLLRNTTNSNLLKRVRHDVSQLRGDVSNLLSHTTHKTLPDGARELLDQAKQQLAAGGNYAVSHLKDLKHLPPRQSIAWVGSAIALGIIGYGIYSYFSKKPSPPEVQEELAFENEVPL